MRYEFFSSFHESSSFLMFKSSWFWFYPISSTVFGQRKSDWSSWNQPIEGRNHIVEVFPHNSSKIPHSLQLNIIASSFLFSSEANGLQGNLCLIFSLKLRFIRECKRRPSSMIIYGCKMHGAYRAYTDEMTSSVLQICFMVMSGMIPIFIAFSASNVSLLSLASWKVRPKHAY